MQGQLSAVHSHSSHDRSCAIECTPSLGDATVVRADGVRKEKAGGRAQGVEPRRRPSLSLHPGPLCKVRSPVGRPGAPALGWRGQSSPRERREARGRLGLTLPSGWPARPLSTRLCARETRREAETGDQ
uniref:Uncharacterized protein n=1 Tax=Plectus sambesii TaxID=2011161 RepID=A0A914VAC4_9BILA